MADFKEPRAYNSKTLAKVFLIASFALLVAIVTMILHDYFKPWKQYQREFMTLERKMDRVKFQEAMSKINVQKYNQLKSSLAAAKASIRSERSQIHQDQNMIAKYQAKIYVVHQDYQFKKIEINALKWRYEQYLIKHEANPTLEKQLNNLIAVDKKLGNRVTVLKLKRNGYGQALTQIYAQKTKDQSTLTAMLRQVNQIKHQYAKMGFTPFFAFRNAPIVNFLSPTIKIHQILLKNLPVDLYFAHTMRVDRCITCHLAIDTPGFENAPEPFTTHPDLKLFLSSNSPHPMNKFGCTVCHGGVGPAVGFISAGHVPNSKAEAIRWKKEYGWHYPVNATSHMLPLKYAEASCEECHGVQQHIDFAPKLDLGRRLLVVRGCIGCHKIKQLENLPKAGPPLIRVKGKLTRAFVTKWIWNPRSFDIYARMPSFFNQSNNSGPKSLPKTKAELVSIVYYLFHNSKNYAPPQKYPGYGNIAKGKKLFHTIGCLACHGIADAMPYHPEFAPDLSDEGSKVTASWIYSWIRDPQNYDPTTRMPNMRLSKRQAANITAYLMSLKNPAFEKEAVPKASTAVRNQMIIHILAKNAGWTGAKQELAKMNSGQRWEFLGKHSIQKYGCFGCHEINGFENAQGIGTDLTTWGSKQLEQLDFGLVKIPHTRVAFLKAKLENPRVFDYGRVASFNNRLKMPNFYLSKRDRQAIMTAVLGLTGNYIPQSMQAGLTGNGPLIEAGDRVICKFNCRACHIIHDQGGRILQYYKQIGLDPSMGPPNLADEGAKVQVKWMYNFFRHVYPIRPWLKIRMPSFPWTDKEIDAVITYFNLRDHQEFPFMKISVPKLTFTEMIQAKKLFNQLECLHCHIVGNHMPKDMAAAAPNLSQVRYRLKPAWILKWLKNPNAIMPGTRMPDFWPNNASPAPNILNGNSKKQREILRDYLYTLGSTSAN